MGSTHKQPIGIHIGEKQPLTRKEIDLQPKELLSLGSGNYAALLETKKKKYQKFKF